MVLNYFIITLRSISRKKIYSFINIAGLTLGMTCCFVIFKYVAFEYSYDRFHENSEYMMSKDFLKLVIIAILIGTPISWYLMQKWLQNFAFRIEISPLFFAFAGLLSILIAIAAVAWQVISAATTNPVKCLRTE